MNEGSKIGRANARLGRKSLVVLTTFVLLLSIACVTPISTACPDKNTRTKTIKIGVIAPWGILGTTDEQWGYDYLDYDYDLFKQLVEPEVNTYLASISNHKLVTQIEFVVRSAYDGSDESFLSAVKQFHKEGIDLIIGGYWSGQAAAALDYINTHNMLLLSPTSTDPNLAIKNDNLFRLAPDDTGLGKPIAATLKERGITKLVVIHADSGWANGVINALDAAYDGDMTSRVAYPAALDDYTVNLNPDYTQYLAAADALLSGSANEGVLMLSYRAEVILQQAVSYPKVYGVEWFGADATALTSFIRDQAGFEATKVKLYSSIAAIDAQTTASSKFQAMSTKFVALFSDTFGFYPACEVDAGWLLALSVVKAQDMNQPLNGKGVVKILPNIASTYHGYSGLCKLNKAGDRVPGNYDVWGYKDGYHLFGTYNTASGILTWLN